VAITRSSARTDWPRRRFTRGHQTARRRMLICNHGNGSAMSIQTGRWRHMVSDGVFVLIVVVNTRLSWSSDNYSTWLHTLLTSGQYVIGDLPIPPRHRSYILSLSLTLFHSSPSSPLTLYLLLSRMPTPPSALLSRTIASESHLIHASSLRLAMA